MAIPTTIPTKILTTIPTAIPTTIPTIKLTTILKPIPTTIITTIPKILPSTIITNIITTIPSTISPTIPITIVQDQCKYGILINYTSSYSNLSNEDIYDLKIHNIISSYCLNGTSVTVKGQDSNFQITTTFNEIKSNDNNAFKLDLTECENILKEKYHIDQNSSLIILKFMTNTGNTIQYELYDPFNHQKLNLSFCEKTKTSVYVPVDLDEKVEELYNNLKEQGYNPLDLNDKFYREICTPYTSENGTDVLLDDREEFIYNSLVNASVCPAGCNYTELIIDKKYIKCECDTNTIGIETLNLQHLSGENIANSMLGALKSTNWKVMRCYNLVFNFKIFCHNFGSILILILFIAYVVFMIYFSIKDISPFKVWVSKLLFEQAKEGKKEKLEKEFKFKTLSEYDFKQAKSEKDKDFFPPKKKVVGPKQKKKIVTFENKNIPIPTIPTEGNKLISDKRKEMKLAKKKDTMSAKSSRKRMADKKSDKPKNMEITRITEEKEKDKKEKEKEKEKILDDFELNNLDYADACNLDKRTCLKIYWSVLKREHSVLLTFISRNDYNLFYVKIEKFFILFCIDMTMSGLFFVHETMRRKYTQNQNMTFVEKLPQFIFTLLVAHALEVLLCYLGMTDTHFYEIKELPSKDKKKGEKVMDILSKIKKKLVSFFCVTFILFLFFWYFISAFCAVYQNTQIIYLRDSMISFAISLIDPFFIYGLTCLLRWISLLTLCKKKCCCRIVFKISDIIPIF